MLFKLPRVLPVWHKHSYVCKKWKGFASSLYIPGDIASGLAVSVVPYVDLSQRFKNMGALKNNILSRGMSINIEVLRDSWELLETEEDRKAALEAEHLQMLNEIRKLKNENRNTEAAVLQEEAKALREQVKSLKRVVWELERKAIIGGLSVPNDLHPLTPTGTKGNSIVEFGPKPEQREDSHLVVASKLDLVDFYDSSFYFLKKEAALFELGLSYYFLDEVSEKGFIHMSNSDFGRSVVLEGVGLDPEDAGSVFVLKGDTSESKVTKLHLVGGASLVSFCAFHAKSVALLSCLPLRYVTIGRHYSPETKNSLPGLFSAWQSSAVEAFIACENSDKASEEFYNLLNIVVDLYKSLGYHFHIEYLPAHSLRPWESLRASIQMYSAHLNCYVEVGNVSMCDDFISKRLLMCCQKGSRKEFLHVVSGTIVSIPHVLGCVLEAEGEDFSSPQIITKNTAPGLRN